MKKYLALAKGRNLKLSGNATIKDAKEHAEMLGITFNLKGTMRLYGLIYIEDRSFFSRYKDFFGMKNELDIYNITMEQLCKYKDMLIRGEESVKVW